jgi:hypothetical protein
MATRARITTVEYLSTDPTAGEPIAPAPVAPAVPEAPAPVKPMGSPSQIKAAYKAGKLTRQQAISHLKLHGFK